MAHLAKLAAESKRWEKILSADSESSDRDFVAAAREVWDRDRGKPSQSVDLTSGGQPLTLTAEERRAELAALLGLAK